MSSFSGLSPKNIQAIRTKLSRSPPSNYDADLVMEASALGVDPMNLQTNLLSLAASSAPSPPLGAARSAAAMAALLAPSGASSPVSPVGSVGTLVSSGSSGSTTPSRYNTLLSSIGKTNAEMRSINSFSSMLTNDEMFNQSGIDSSKRKNFNDALAELRSAPAAAASGSFFDYQAGGMKCALFALNHVLQEKKFIWDSTQPGMLIGGADPMAPNVQINVSTACNTHEDELLKFQAREAAALKTPIVVGLLDGTRKAPELAEFHARTLAQRQRNFASQLAAWQNDLAEAQRKFGTLWSSSLTPEEKTAQITAALELEERQTIGLEFMNGSPSICWSDDAVRRFAPEDPGNLPTEVIPPMLSFLNYDFLLLTPQGGTNIMFPFGDIALDESQSMYTVYSAKLLSELPKPNCIGAVVNIEYPEHYIAIVKYSKEAACSGKYTIVDSMAHGSITNCVDVADVERTIDPRGPRGIVFIYDKAESYQSVAQRNRDAAAAAASAAPAPAPAAAPAAASASAASSSGAGAGTAQEIEIYKVLGDAKPVVRNSMFSLDSTYKSIWDTYSKREAAGEKFGGGKRKTRNRRQRMNRRRNTRRHRR